MNLPHETVTPRDFWRQGLFVMVAVIFFSLPQTVLMPLLDRDEPKFAEASREMRQSGDFIIPMFNHAPRYNKPPLIYWCQTLAFDLFGENAFAARLPSVLATAGTALLLFAWGVQLGSTCIGMIAAFSYAFCFQVMQQGRVATADGLLIFFMTLTAYTGWRLLSHRPPPKGHPAPRSIFRTASTLRAWTFRLILAFAFGFLAKGPEAWLPLIPLVLLAGTWRGRFYFLLCYIFSLILAGCWGLPAYLASHGDYWRVGMSEGVIQRSVTGLEGHGASTFGLYLVSLPFYLLLFWISALPWSPLLVIQRKKLFGGWTLDPTDRYLLLHAILIFAIFSLMVTKLPHYTLPAFPFLILLFARRWMAAGLSPVLPTQLTAGMGIAFAVISAISIPLLIAHGATCSPVGTLVREAGPNLTPTTSFALVDFKEPNTIWEMRRVVQGYGATLETNGVLPFLNEPGPHAVVLTTKRWKEIASETPSGYLTYSARGLNGAKLALIDLTLVIKL